MEGEVGPVTARYLVDAIHRADRQNVECLVIELDTPGGLDTSMRQVIKEMLASDVPIVVYVSPSGSRAASAGAFITLAANVAAMAPGTNIGAAHPVNIGAEKVDSTMTEKIANDAAAFIKSIAQKRGRNVKWAEDAVRKSVSVTESEAVKENVVDFVCGDLRALLDSLDGLKTIVASGERVLHTRGAEILTFEMGPRYRILATIANPNIAYVLFMLGLLGLYFELSNPGAILPGVVGGISLILAFFSFQVLSINYAGLLLIIFATILFIADLKAPTHGVLTVGGIIAMTLGSLMLFNAPEPALRVSWGVLIATVAVTALFFTFAIGMGIRAQQRKATTGAKGLLDAVAVVRTRIEGEGRVFVNGELWRAEADEVIEEGAKVRVLAVDGLTLKVRKL
jgi:membrane-bound serine protease (ClpP class)